MQFFIRLSLWLCALLALVVLVLMIFGNWSASQLQSFAGMLLMIGVTVFTLLAAGRELRRRPPPLTDAENEKLEEIRAESEHHQQLRVFGSDDPVTGELINRIWKSGKPTMATVDENGEVTFKELD